MRFKFYIAIIVLLMVSNSEAQVQVDSSNIVRQILQKQIEDIRANKSKAAEHAALTIPVRIKNQKKQSMNKSEIKFALNPAFIKFSVLSVASFLAFGFVFIRRKKNDKKGKKKLLKENIRKIRDEQLVVSIDPRLKAIRKKLVLNSSYLKVGEEQTKFAKKNQIGESELLLAMKLKDYQMESAKRGVL